MREEAVVRMPRVHRLSLSATGTPASGSVVHDRGSRSIAAARAERLLGGDRVEGVQRGLSASIRVEGVAADVDRAAARRALDRSRISRTVRERSSDDPRHLEEARVEVGVGRIGERRLAVEARCASSGRSARMPRQHAGRRWNTAGVDVLYLNGVFENLASCRANRSISSSSRWRCASAATFSISAREKPAGMANASISTKQQTCASR